MAEQESGSESKKDFLLDSSFMASMLRLYSFNDAKADDATSTKCDNDSRSNENGVSCHLPGASCVEDKTISSFPGNAKDQCCTLSEDDAQSLQKRREPTPNSTSLPIARGKEYYRTVLLQQAEQLLYTLDIYGYYFKVRNKFPEEMGHSSLPHPFEAAEIKNRNPLSSLLSTQLSKEDVSFRIDEVPSSEAVLPAVASSSPVAVPPPSPSSEEEKVAAPCHVQPYSSYMELLSCRKKELHDVTAGFNAYVGEMATIFKQPQTPMPEHLLNSFGNVDVILARNHKERMDIVKCPPGAVENPLCNGELGDESVSLTGRGCAMLRQPPLGSGSMDCPPRFTIESLPNGDLREHDALAGYAHWESEEPVLPKCILPSQLLDEKAAEALHNYRFYSLRWRKMLNDIANTVGGEEGAELLRRYETRESSLPQLPKCQRSFYESNVDYETLLNEQEHFLAAVEQNLDAHRLLLLDDAPGDV